MRSNRCRFSSPLWAQALVEDVKILPALFKNLLDPDYLFSDQICTILSNLSRSEETCKTVFKVRLACSHLKPRAVASRRHVDGLW